MSVDEVIINEEALSDVADSIKTYVASLKSAIEDAIRSIKATGGDWSDEDFESLVASISSLKADAEGLEDAAEQINARISDKINAIHALHSMKI